MITFCEIEIGAGGIAPCVMCSRKDISGAGPYPSEAVRERLVEAARGWCAGPGPNVTFGGFEPFSHPELPVLIRMAIDLGYGAVRLTTDAGALSMPGNAEGAIAAGVRQIEVVLLADGDEHDRLTGREGLFEAADAGVRSFLDAAARAGVPVAVTGLVPFCRHNAEHAPLAVARLAQWGSVAVHVNADKAPEANRPFVIAALDTAAANACAGSVSGLDGEVPVPWAIRPWRTIGAGA